jgi:hypothetical protein
VASPPFRRDPRRERQLLWGMVALVGVVAAWLGIMTYFLSTTKANGLPQRPSAAASRPSRSG